MMTRRTSNTATATAWTGGGGLRACSSESTGGSYEDAGRRTRR
jgi:hypothetical protein